MGTNNRTQQALEELEEFKRVIDKCMAGLIISLIAGLFVLWNIIMENTLLSCSFLAFQVAICIHIHNVRKRYKLLYEQWKEKNADLIKEAEEFGDEFLS